MLNQREQLAIVLLIGVLVLGSAVAVVDYYRSGAVEDLRVLPAAVPYPAASPQGPQPNGVQGAGVTSVARPALAAPGDSAGIAATVAVAGPWLVALNTAPAAELESLPGIGPKLAARIIAYRSQHGPFARVADLEQVPGIGPRTLARLAPLVEVQSAPRAPGSAASSIAE